MPLLAHAPTGLLRVVTPPEPRPGLTAPCDPSGQLSIPTQVRQWVLPVPRQIDLPPEPGHAQLRQLLAALVEVVDGRRPADRVSHKVSANLHTKLRRQEGMALGARFVIRRVHVDRAKTGTLEVCATVHTPRSHRAFAVAGKLQAFWHGWAVTDFEVLLPPWDKPQSVTAA